MDAKKLKDILDKHLKWLRGEDGGERADLYGANLSGADLSGANLSWANLSGADLSRAKHVESAKNLFYPIACPESGSFIGWKKARSNGASVIVELQITEDAKRCSASSRKCRCSKAVVISIKSINGDEDFARAESGYNASFVYEVGKTVSVNNFDDNRWNECSTGIHFYITREEAVRHVL